MIKENSKKRFSVMALLTIIMILTMSLNVFAEPEANVEASNDVHVKRFTYVAPEEEEPELSAEEMVEKEIADEKEAAMTYIDSYSDMITADENFDENLYDAIDVARDDIPFYATWLSLLPPLIAIILALITKEVYSSLFIGILTGALLYANFNVSGTIDHLFAGGFISAVADPYNIGIIIFLVVLGAIVSLMNKAGGSAAFGQWAAKHIKSKIGAQLATVCLGVLIFIDDYFNCLTVGSVMRPVTDKFKISRSKLAYLIDATAAPICIIAPVSSWAAAVTGFVSESEISGFGLFIRAIPYNFYAILTIVMMVGIVLMKFDYGPMKKHEKNAENGDLHSSKLDELKEYAEEHANTKGSVWDLVAPVLVLIIACVIGMIYSGGFFTQGADGYNNFITAFSGADASVGLVIGSFIGLIFSIIYFMARRVLKFKDCMDSIPEGFKAMVPAIMILACAWTLKVMTDSLGAKVYIAEFVRLYAQQYIMLLPAIVFLIGVGLSFATGTSWGTFGILIPIVLAIFNGSISQELCIVSISACMAGAVCGDHCSPISDTTIMASAGAQSNHINHVSTQLPYALTVAAVSLVTYIIAGFVPNAWITLPIGVVLMVGTLVVLKFTVGKNK